MLGRCWCQEGKTPEDIPPERVQKFLTTIYMRQQQWENMIDDRPCKGRNGNVCVAEGCFGESCLK